MRKPLRTSPHKQGVEGVKGTDKPKQRYSLSLRWMDEEMNEQSKTGWWYTLEACKQAARVLQNNNPEDSVEVIDHKDGHWIVVEF
jgi:hypothetical protein